MTVNLPATIWAPTDGIGELSPSSGAFIDTESDLDLITESDIFLIIEDSTFTQIPSSTWVEDDSL